MKKKDIKENIEEVLIRLIALEWTLDSLKRKDMSSIKALLDFFNKEIQECLKSFERFYSEIVIPKKKVLKRKKERKNVKTCTKKKTKKSTKNSKSKEKN